jgi:hypothetical protein
MASKKVFRISFLNQGQVYEIYAKSVSHGEMFGFVEVAELLFGEKTQMVVDPSEERLKTEFSGVRRTFIPMHAVIRIDEVEKGGSGTIRSLDGKSPEVAHFPMPVFPRGKNPGTKR